MSLILLIDDDAKIRSMILRMLTPAHDVIEAKNGREGIEFIKERQPDLVITDIMMPEQDGIETIREIRKTIPGVRVIAISGSQTHASQPNYLEHAKAFGANAILPKPFRAKELVNAVNAVLSITRVDPAWTTPDQPGTTA